jgi:hypothetical protein
MAEGAASVAVGTRNLENFIQAPATPAATSHNDPTARGGETAEYPRRVPGYR